jgi:hypothetical protein
MIMVILTFYYTGPSNEDVSYSTDPLPAEHAMQRVFKFVQGGIDIINHYDTGSMEVLLLHRVTGITLTPVA